MTSILNDLGYAVVHLFKSQRKLIKWVERASTDDVREGLTRVFLHGSANMGVGPALTANELAAFQERFKSVSLRETGLEECLSFYAGYPFQPLALPLSREDLLRAVIELTGRDAKALEQKWAIRVEGKDYVFLQGRNPEDRLRLLFAALAGGAPTQENILDVLSLVKPCPDECQLPYGHDKLRPMAMRLVATAVSSTTKGLTIPREKLVAFVKAINLESPVLEADEIDLDAFADTANKSGFINAISQRVEALFFKS